MRILGYAEPRLNLESLVDARKSYWFARGALDGWNGAITNRPMPARFKVKKLRSGRYRISGNLRGCVTHLKRLGGELNKKTGAWDFSAHGFRRLKSDYKLNRIRYVWVGLPGKELDEALREYSAGYAFGQRKATTVPHYSRVTRNG